MKRAEHDGFLLETADGTRTGLSWSAWISNPAREIVGYGAGLDEYGAIQDAMRAWNTARTGLAAELWRQACQPRV